MVEVGDDLNQGNEKNLGYLNFIKEKNLQKQIKSLGNTDSFA